MRLNKFLAKAGIASRRKCDILIEGGKVQINGKVLKDYSYQVSNEDLVICDGKLVDLIFQPVLYLFYKPKGVISTVNDPQKRKTVLDYFNGEQRLFPIGRLDRDTTGVLLITNDGGLAHQLMHPSFKIERIYLVKTKISIRKTGANELRSGLTLENGEKVTGKLTLIHKYQNTYHYEIKLREGKNREVKRIFRTLGSKVESLHRTSFAGIGLKNLKVGQVKKISVQQVKNILNLEN